MELYKDILIRLLENRTVKVEFPDFEEDLISIVKEKCYLALNEIARIIRDDTLTDKDCFLKIEEIVCVLERNGIDFGTRHDFG